MKILFFEVRLIGISRYAQDIARKLYELSSDIEFVFVYDQADDFSINKLDIPGKSTVRSVGKVSYRNVSRLIIEEKPNILVVFAQRIPDSAFVSIANKNNIKTIMVQHGMYVPFMKRNLTMFLSNLAKTFRYIQYSNVVARANGMWGMAMLNVFFNRFVSGRLEKIEKKLSNLTNVTEVHVYGDYWKKYHRECYGYPENVQKIIGAPDLDGVTENASPILVRQIGYVAQSLVEDGRIGKAYMLKFLSELAEVCRKECCRLKVKLHPRTDKSIYASMKDVVDFVDDISDCKVVVGHYSSLIAKYFYTTDSVLIVELNGHPTHECFCSEEVLIVKPCDLENEISKSLNSKFSKERYKAIIDGQKYYFSPTVGGAMNNSALIIYEYMNMQNRVNATS